MRNVLRVERESEEEAKRFVCLVSVTTKTLHRCFIGSQQPKLENPKLLF